MYFFILPDDQLETFICSIDGVPFLMHDKTFRRTTNIADVFPDRVDEPASMFNISDIKKLNAGQWFIDVSLLDHAFNIIELHKKIKFQPRVTILFILQRLSRRLMNANKVYAFMCKFFGHFLEERERLNTTNCNFIVFFSQNYRLILMVQYHNYRTKRRLCTATKVSLHLLKFCG